MKIFLLLSILFFGIACGDGALDEGENYGNLLDSPEGLVLTEGEHPAGWGRAECTTCHNLDNIHLVDRTGIGVDIEAIHQEALDEGNEGCLTCHGANGVE